MKKKITRRDFLKNSLQIGAGAALTSGLTLGNFGKIPKSVASTGTPPRVILVSIDGLDARALDLDRNGEHGGCSNNWLMPNVRTFLDSGTHFSNATCYLPSATDMNHLNAVSGTHTGENGINMVSVQLSHWKTDGTPVLKAPSMSFAKNGAGDAVDTLFNAWKRKWPQSRTFYTSGKEWVANMFKTSEVNTDVDIIIGGEEHPAYVSSPPYGNKYYDPPSDDNPWRDPESREQKVGSGIMNSKPEQFPVDTWVVDASLEMLKREQPDFGVILLAQMDDLQHVLGACNDPNEFETNYIFRKGFVSQSKYLDCVYREAILDGMKEVDLQFGRLIDGIQTTPGYEDTLIVLYSDHGFVTHRNAQNIARLLLSSVVDYQSAFRNTDPVYVLNQAGLLSEAEKIFKGFMPITATSFGVLHFQGDTMVQRIHKAMDAKRALLDHRAWNADTRRYECPWYVLDLEDMENGLPGVCAAGELFHNFYGYKNEPGTIHWPDIFLFAKNYWQLPAQANLITNVGITLPDALTDFLNPLSIFLGGHGSTDAQEIVMGFSGSGISAKEISNPCRISDIATTLASLLGLDLRTASVGNDLSGSLS